MSGYQRQNGDIVELTAAGLEAVRSHKNNYADSTRPLACSKFEPKIKEKKDK